MTTNPVVESWGHFPRAKRRLLDILIKTNPKGLVIVSGDVHHGELSQINVTHTNSGETVGHITEVTSSGLTHSCTSPSLVGRLCPIMLKLFQDHRMEIDSFYTGKNVAKFVVNDAYGKEATIALLSLETSVEGKAVFSYTLDSSKIYDDKSSNKEFLHAEHPNFPSIYCPSKFAWMYSFLFLFCVMKNFSKPYKMLLHILVLYIISIWNEERPYVWYITMVVLPLFLLVFAIRYLYKDTLMGDPQKGITKMRTEGEAGR